LIRTNGKGALIFSSSQPLLSTRQVAELFGVSNGTVHRWVTNGELCSFTIGGSVRLRCEDIDVFIQNCEKERAQVSA
jgi:excisionase family DNA binding protein